MSNLAIETQKLTKTYKHVDVVDGLSMAVPEGAIYCLLGRNGSGKTTTIRMLLGLARPTNGSAKVLGLDSKQDRLQILARTGFVSDKPLLNSMSGNELVRFNAGFYSRWSNVLVKKYADLFDIPLKTKFRNMSRGNQTKMWLLLALAQQPDLLILDEPTAGLDPVVTDELLRVLIDDFLRDGRTVFLSSHHIAEVERIADWVGILDHGKLILEARTEDLRANVRRVQVIGNDLSRMKNAQVLRTRDSEGTTEFIVTHDAETFTASLENQGATVLQNAPMNLSEVFLEYVRKEKA
jgi:ABC-2 type transport system ATP-binding protein